MNDMFGSWSVSYSKDDLFGSWILEGFKFELSCSVVEWLCTATIRSWMLWRMTCSELRSILIWSWRNIYAPCNRWQKLQLLFDVGSWVFFRSSTNMNKHEKDRSGEYSYWKEFSLHQLIQYCTTPPGLSRLMNAGSPVSFFVHCVVLNVHNNVAWYAWQTMSLPLLLCSQSCLARMKCYGLCVHSSLE